MAATLSATGASETFLSVSGVLGAWTWMGTVLLRSHNTVASMDSGPLDIVNGVLR